jgi:ABC-type microcin C transport system permease subunit YejB
MKHKLFDLLRRIGLLVLVVWTVVSLVTILIELVPGDPAVAVLGEQATPEQLAQFRTKHGLDRPPFFFGLPIDEHGQRHFKWYGLSNRYDDYWIAILHGDLGKSFRTDQPVFNLILERYPATIELAIGAGVDRDQSSRFCDWTNARLRLCSKAGLAGAVRALRVERHYLAGSNFRRGALCHPDENGAIVRDRRVN